MATNPMLPVREGRLRNGAPARFSWAPRDTWLPAGALADLALRQADRLPTDERVLSDDAFEFRGGRQESVLRRRARTRRSDHAIQVVAPPASRR